MSDEDDFQRALDENPDDFGTRGVFADWLEERDDPRWMGYRWAARERKRPDHPDMPKSIGLWCDSEASGASCLPERVTRRLPMSDIQMKDKDRIWKLSGPAVWHYSSRRVAEDALAAAIYELETGRKLEPAATS